VARFTYNSSNLYLKSGWNFSTSPKEDLEFSEFNKASSTKF